MIVLIIKLGGWTSKIYTCSSDIALPMQKIRDIFSTYCIDGNENELACNLAILNSEIEEPTDLFHLLPNYKNKLPVEFTSTLFDALGPSKVNFHSFSWPYPSFSNCKYPLRSLDKSLGDFAALIINNPTKGSFVEIYLYIMFLASIWHIQRGGLLIHSCGVIRGKDGYLFLGESGAGKSTIAEMSASLGFQILGDDLNFILPNCCSQYTIAAAPSVKQMSFGGLNQQPCVKGIFKLVKDENDSLIRMSSIETAKILFASVMQTPKSIALPQKIFGNVFQTTSLIAKLIPCYELHFRKTPEFWNMINSENYIDEGR